MGRIGSCGFVWEDATWTQTGTGETSRGAMDGSAQLDPRGGVIGGSRAAPYDTCTVLGPLFAGWGLVVAMLVV